MERLLCGLGVFEARWGIAWSVGHCVRLGGYTLNNVKSIRYGFGVKIKKKIKKIAVRTRVSGGKHWRRFEAHIFTAELWYRQDHDRTL